MAALRLDPKRGFEVTWRRELRSLAFSALVGGARDREIVIPDLTPRGEQVVWIDEATGRERARSEVLAQTPAPGNIVTPGFAGRFFHVSAQGALVELRPDTAKRDAVLPDVRVVRLTPKRVFLELSEDASVTVRIRRAGTRGAAAVARTNGGAGALRIAVGRRPRRPGRYAVEVNARDDAGNPAEARRVVRVGEAWTGRFHRATARWIRHREHPSCLQIASATPAPISSWRGTTKRAPSADDVPKADTPRWNRSSSGSVRALAQRAGGGRVQVGALRRGSQLQLVQRLGIDGDGQTHVGRPVGSTGIEGRGVVEEVVELLGGDLVVVPHGARSLLLTW